MERTECFIPPDGVLPPCDQRIAALHRYWRSLWPAGGGLPGRKHFNPAAVPDLLPWIWMLDVHRDPLRFKYRLLGTGQVAIIGRDRTGAWIDEQVPNFFDAPAFRHYAAVAEQGLVCYRRGFPVVHVPKDFMLIERVFLPFAKDGRTVDIILALTVYYPAGNSD